MHLKLEQKGALAESATHRQVTPTTCRTQLKQKGGSMIGRYLKDIEELFIGATGTTKEGFLAICKNCTKLKRLSVVANEITTEVVTEILLGLKDLQWLDLSYCNLNKNDR